MSIIKAGTWQGFPIYVGDDPELTSARSGSPCVVIVGRPSIDSVNALVGDSLTDACPAVCILATHEQMRDLRYEMYLKGMAQFEATP